MPNKYIEMYASDKRSISADPRGAIIACIDQILKDRGEWLKHSFNIKTVDKTFIESEDEFFPYHWRPDSWQPYNANITKRNCEDLIELKGVLSDNQLPLLRQDLMKSALLVNINNCCVGLSRGESRAFLTYVYNQLDARETESFQLSDLQAADSASILGGTAT